MLYLLDITPQVISGWEEGLAGMCWLLCPDSRCWDGVMREDEADTGGTGDLAGHCYVWCALTRQRAGRATHCYVSYLLHTSDCSLLTPHRVCVSREFLHHTRAPCPGSHPALSPCPASPDLRIPRPSPRQAPGQPRPGKTTKYQRIWEIHTRAIWNCQFTMRKLRQICQFCKYFKFL